MQLIVDNGPRAGLTYSIEDQVLTVGRQVDATISLPEDRKVSRDHARILRGPDGHFMVVDTASSNGTFVDGVRIERAILMPDQVLRIGSTEFRCATVSDEERRRESLYRRMPVTPRALRASLLDADDPEIRTVQLSTFQFGIHANPEWSPETLLRRSMALIAGTFFPQEWAWLRFDFGLDKDPIVVCGGGASGEWELDAWMEPYVDIARESSRLRQAITPTTSDVNPVIAAPISAPGGSLGALVLVRESEYVTDAELRHVAVMSSQVSAALRNTTVLDGLRAAYRDVEKYLDQLNKAEKLATVGRLASGFAHDLNTPLSSLLGFIELGQRALDGDDFDRTKLLKYLERARDAADYCRAMSRNVLSFTRQNTFDENGAERSFDFGQTVRNAISMAEHGLRRSGVSIDVDLESDLTMAGDPTALQQIILNLVTNAADAIGETGSKEGVVRVAARRVNDQIEIAVEDNGPGISEEVQKQIFEPLFTTKAEHRGTGLGLYVVSTIVTDAGGQLALDSVPGSGSRFTITLPGRIDSYRPEAVVHGTSGVRA